MEIKRWKRQMSHLQEAHHQARKMGRIETSLGPRVSNIFGKCATLHVIFH